MRIVVGLQLRVSRLHLRHVVMRIECQPLHFALLLGKHGQILRERLRRKGAALDAARQLLRGQRVAHALVILIGRHALHGEQFLVAVHIDGTVRILERRDDRIAQQRAAHRVVRGGQMQTLRFIGQHALLDQAVEHFLAALGRIEHLRVELSTEHLARSIQLLTHRVVVLGPGDLVTVDAGDVCTFVKEATEALNTHKTQPRYDDQDEHEHHQAFVIAEEIEHALRMPKTERPILQQRAIKKANRSSPFKDTGGVDGTRTRDPRRDRPVF